MGDKVRVGASSVCPKDRTIPLSPFLCVMTFDPQCLCFYGSSFSIFMLVLAVCIKINTSLSSRSRQFETEIHSSNEIWERPSTIVSLTSVQNKFSSRRTMSSKKKEEEEKTQFQSWNLLRNNLPEKSTLKNGVWDCIYFIQLEEPCCRIYLLSN